MKIIELYSEKDIAEYMLNSNFNSYVIDFDFTITAFDSTKAVNFWLYDVVNNCNRRLKLDSAGRKIFRLLSSRVIGVDMLNIIDIHHAFSKLSDSEIQECLFFLHSLPVNHHIIESIKLLKKRGVYLEVISGGYLPIVKALCEYYIGSIGVHAQMPRACRIKGNKHKFVINPTSESCLITDNSEDLGFKGWKNIVYYNFRKSIIF